MFGFITHSKDQNEQIAEKNALKHVLKSIAHIEAGMSETINLCAEEISFCTGLYGHEKSTLSHIIELNSSINRILKCIIQLQILLDLKLINIIKVYPPVTKQADLFTSSTLAYCLHDISSKESNPFFSGISAIKLCINNKPEEQETNFCYSTHNGAKMLVISALPDSSGIKMTYDSETITIEGACTITYKEQFMEYITYTTGNFKLSIHYTPNNLAENSLRLILKGCDNSVFNYDSGNIRFKYSSLDLKNV